ncbi:YicC family protein [Sporolactobacillus shoreae]|uniref:YicC family protein n=1 Tax=Sporolactobacillus shoreae TaxID=1465501 RepID=A0A4Z0GS59_9BACL|nr:YicC/YloC family endoribonuclease [Sporolactobacillus shoreae]TGB00234.1 YicC family protein [Sporolactobacillus shoreae]
MINSMTGFGAASLTEGETRVRVELKSVNHRYFELSLNLPRPLMYMESQIRKTVHSFFHRGSLTLFLTVEGNSAVAPKLCTNWGIVNQYIDAVRKIQKLSGTSDLNFNGLLNLPGIFTIQEADGFSAEGVDPLILKIVEQASMRLLQMRQVEGEQLRQDLLKKAEQIARQVEDLSDEAPKVQKHYEQQLRHHVTDFLSGNQAIDEDRLMTEIALFADKSAIDEELTRMKSHIRQLSHLLKDSAEAVPVGRQLDFLIQEMNREMNTIGSKGNSLAISHKVVLAKSEIEKLREQVQNVE